MSFKFLLHAAMAASLIGALLSAGACLAQNVDWPAYNGGRDGDHY